MMYEKCDLCGSDVEIVPLSEIFFRDEKGRVKGIPKNYSKYCLNCKNEKCVRTKIVYGNEVFPSHTQMYKK